MHLGLAPRDLLSDVGDLLAEMLMCVFRIHSTHPREADVQLPDARGSPNLYVGPTSGQSGNALKAKRLML